jgi:hypothetical protein
MYKILDLLEYKNINEQVYIKLEFLYKIQKFNSINNEIFDIQYNHSSLIILLYLYSCDNYYNNFIELGIK